MMRFLFPGFLFALSLVVIPVIIHLFNFRKIRTVYFSNVSLLREIEQKSSSPRRIRKVLLLLFRIFTLIFVVLAFARPYIPSLGEEAGGPALRSVSIYIDNSYSMELLNKDGNLLDEAKRRAKEIASAYGINDRFQLLTNDFEGRHQRFLNYEAFVEAVDEVKVSGANRSIEEIVRRQDDALSGESGRDKEAYLLSDFQKSMLMSERLEGAKDVSYRLVKLEAPEQPNVSVDSVWFLSPVHRSGEPERLIVRIKNNSDKKMGDIPVKLLIEGQQRALGSISISPRSSVADTLSFSGLSEGWKQGEVSITDYPVTFDDRLFFSFYVRKSMQLLVINMSDENPYIRAVYAADPFFLVKNVNAGNVDYSEIASFPLVLVNGTEIISEGLIQQLKIYVRNGGNLLICPSASNDLTGLQRITRALGTDIPSGISMQEARVSAVNYQHPLFRGVFERIPQKPDLPLALKYVEYNRESRVAASSIMDLPGKRNFLSQYSIGRGTVYLFAVPLSEEWSNFVRHSFFVPVMYQSAFLSLRDKPLSYTVGRDNYFELNRISLSPNQALRLKSKETEIIPDMRQSESGTRLFIADQIREAGQYSLFKGDSLLARVAFNDNRQESDLSYTTRSELDAFFKGYRADVYEPATGPLKNTIKAANYGVQLWKLCLILALIFMAGEILLLKYYRKADGLLRS